jgi:tRNA G26 N,N-dimethylase Trm1
MLGWRIARPNEKEVIDSMQEGLTPMSSTESLPMHCFLPLSYPVNREDKRVSGPLWIGPLGDSRVMASFTEEEVTSMCTTEYDPKNPMNWEERDFELERRKIIRSIKNIRNESEVVTGEFLILTDDLASWRNVGSPPSPVKMIEIINEKGFKAGLSHYPKPSFRTNAPWDVIVESLDLTQPPM